MIPTRSRHPLATAVGLVTALLARRDGLARKVTALARPMPADQLRQLERRAAEKEAAGRADAQKAAFLAAVSHKIRAPTNELLGAIDLLAARERPADERWLLEAARRSGEALLTILEDMLDLADLEAGTTALEPAGFGVAELVDAEVALCRARAEAKGLALAVAIHPAVPARLVGDAGRVRQMLRSYLVNALAFTPHGGIAVRVVPAVGTARPWVRFVVADTGPGIAPEDRSGLFEARDRPGVAGGLGLGLAITRGLAERMGGRVGCDSEPGQGSTFWFDLPWREAAAPSPCRAHGVDGGCARAASSGSLGQMIGNMSLQPARAIAETGGGAGDETLDRAAIELLYDDLGDEVVNDILLTAVADLERHGRALLACTEAEPHAIERSAHALAGISASVGAVALASLARRVEQVRALSGDRAALQAALERACAALTAVVAARDGTASPDDA
jgi:signal transduction histidine kinase/HPt (histidine-containing phosphotransfer) domain-containing protein